MNYYFVLSEFLKDLRKHQYQKYQNDQLVEFSTYLKRGTSRIIISSVFVLDVNNWLTWTTYYYINIICQQYRKK